MDSFFTEETSLILDSLSKLIKDYKQETSHYLLTEAVSDKYSESTHNVNIGKYQMLTLIEDNLKELRAQFTKEND